MNAFQGKLFFTVKEVATMCSFSTDTVYRLIARGILKASPSVRHKLVTASSLKRFVEAAENGSNGY